MSDLYNETREILKRYGVNANKSLGQNFLIDETVVQKIVETANINKKDLVIEIGPGLGTLTKILIERAGKVICIELDTKMVNIIEDRFKEKVQIINEDVLKVNLNNLIEAERERLSNVKIVANLPYYITTPIIMKLLEDKLRIESITVMIQKEVADRLTCTPGDKETGAITHAIYYYTEAEKTCIVPNTSFIPMPEVTSEIIKLTPRKEPAVIVKDERKLFKIIKVAFMQRRKTLLNGLANSGIINKEEAKKVFKELGINENIRGEKLTLEQFAKISEHVKQM